jgi:tetratricopeptide (TPR) repeat protein
MMKFQYAVNLGLATVLVVPAVTLGIGQNDALEVTLRRTVEALDQLAAIEQRLHDRDPGAIHDALRFSEAALEVPADRPQARDELLVGLRGEVARLQRESEALEARAATPQSTPVLPPPPELEVSPTAQGPATLGLDDAARRKLSVRAKPVVAPASLDTVPQLESASPPAREPKQAFEADGYAADAFRLGRAYYRQGRFDLALQSFEADATNPEAMYWRARALEKLGRNADAIAAYGRVIALPEPGFCGERAKEDLEFLQWRLEFDRSRSNNAEKRP